MASTNSNKGRAVVLSAACVTMFFISSIALYSVVSKNLLAVYPEWSSALTWAFPVFQTIMAVTGIFLSQMVGCQKSIRTCMSDHLAGYLLQNRHREPGKFELIKRRFKNGKEASKNLHK